MCIAEGSAIPHAEADQTLSVVIAAYRVQSNHFRNPFFMPGVKCAVRHRLPAFLIASA